MFKVYFCRHIFKALHYGIVSYQQPYQQCIKGTQNLNKTTTIQTYLRQENIYQYLFIIILRYENIIKENIQNSLEQIDFRHKKRSKNVHSEIGFSKNSMLRSAINRAIKQVIDFDTLFHE